MKKNPRIVVLDGYTINPGDLSWDELQSLGECKIFDRTSPEKVLDRAEGAGIILINKTILDREIIESLPDMKYIGVMATGYNVVNLKAAVNGIFRSQMYLYTAQNRWIRWQRLQLTRNYSPKYCLV